MDLASADMKAIDNPATRTQICELYRGQLSASQAAQLNEWTDDTAGRVELTQVTSSSGEARELAVARLEGECYAGIAAIMPGAQNCATWVEATFPGTISAPLGIPRFCTAVKGG
jgi:hypothetical protein